MKIFNSAILLLLWMVTLTSGEDIPKVKEASSAILFTPVGEVAVVAIQGTIWLKYELANTTRDTSTLCDIAHSLEDGEQFKIKDFHLKELQEDLCTKLESRLWEYLLSQGDASVAHHPVLVNAVAARKRREEKKQRNLKRDKRAASPLPPSLYSRIYGALDHNITLSKNDSVNITSSLDITSDIVTVGNTTSVQPGLGALSLLRSFGNLFGLLSRTKRSVLEEEDKSDSDRDIIIKRTKRFVGALIGSAVTGLIGLVAGLTYHGDEVKRSELVKYAKISERHSMMEDQAIAELGAKLNDSLTEMNSYSHLTIYAVFALRAQLQLIIQHQRVGDLLRGLTQLNHRELDPTIVDMPHLHAQLDALKKDMEAKGATPVFSDPRELYGFDVSSFFNSSSLTMNVRLFVPGEMKGSRRLLKRWKPFPLKTEGLSDSVYVLPKVQSTLVSLGTSASGQANLRPVLAEDLAACHRHGPLYLCRPDRMELIEDNHDCLSALYDASLHPSASRVASRCPFEPAKTQNFAIRTGPTNFRIFLARSEPLIGRCPSGTTSLGHHHGLLDVTVPSGCKVSTSAFDLFPDQTLRGLPALLENHDVTVTSSSSDIMAAFKAFGTTLTYAPGQLTLDQAKTWISREESVLTTSHSLVHTALYCGLALAVLIGLFFLLRCCNISVCDLCRVSISFCSAFCRPTPPKPQDPPAYPSAPSSFP